MLPIMRASLLALLPLLLLSCRHELPRGDLRPADRSREPAHLDVLSDRPSDLPRADAPYDARPEKPAKGDQRVPDGPKLDVPKGDKPAVLDKTKGDKPAVLDKTKGEAKPPLVTWQGSCTSPEETVGVAGQCASTLRSLYPDTAGSVSIDCSPSDGGTASAQVGCVNQNWSITRIQSATCGSATIVGGGCDCGTASIVSSYPISPGAPHAWSCACSDSVTPTTHVICAILPFSVRISNTGCASGERQIGGGCHCPAGVLKVSQPSGDDWSCVCENGSWSRWSICAQ
jgi:hypothetical protein